MIQEEADGYGWVTLTEHNVLVAMYLRDLPDKETVEAKGGKAYKVPVEVVSAIVKEVQRRHALEKKEAEREQE